MKYLNRKRKGKNRIINRLREKFGGVWWFDQKYRCWRGPEFVVRSYSELSPTHDLDDETSVTVYYRDDTKERLYL